MAIETYRWIKTFSFGQEHFCSYMLLNLEIPEFVKSYMQNFIKRTFLFTKRTFLFTKRTFLFTKRTVLFTKRTFLFTKKTFLFTKKTFLFIYAFELKENWTKIWEWLKRKTCKKLHAKSHHDKNHLNLLSLVACHLVCGPIDHYVCNEWLLWALLNNSNKSLKRIVLEIS